ncbi:hypothetical protein [Timonella sp. A28]|uniref:hypothetical protein n=1 Tax=Timonella sp. A28 TaxID=3442640 RepID=UPI003EB6EA73
MRRTVTYVALVSVTTLLAACSGEFAQPAHQTQTTPTPAQMQEDMVINAETLFDLDTFKAIKANYDVAGMKQAKEICYQIAEIREEIGIKEFVAGVNGLSEQEYGYADKFQDLLYSCSHLESDALEARKSEATRNETTAPEPTLSNDVLSFTANQIFSSENSKMLNAFDLGTPAMKVKICMVIAKETQNLSDQDIVQHYNDMTFYDQTIFDDLVRECNEILN